MPGLTAEQRRRPARAPARADRTSSRPKRRRAPAPGALRRALRRALLALPAAAVLGGGAWLAASGAGARLGDEARAAAIGLSADAGLRLAEVYVEGRGWTRREDVLDALGVAVGDPILGIDPHAAREALASIPWVRAAEVERRLPDTLWVRLVERRPMALWQVDGRMSLIDDEGRVVTDRELHRFRELPLVVGAGADRHAKDLLVLLSAHPEIAARTAAAVRVGERRWDLRLRNGVTVRLPQAGTEAAMARLAAAEAAEPFLHRDIVAVDLRRDDRLVVQLTADAADRLRPPPPPPTRRNRS
jgi:cell division protein FtsQ